MWIASLPLWTIAIFCARSAVHIALHVEEVEEGRAPGTAGLACILALCTSSAFAVAGTYVWGL